MLRSLLQAVRNIAPLNTLVRSGLHLTAAAVSKLESHWRVSGVVPIRFDGMVVPFYTRCDDDVVDTLYYDKSYYEYNDLKLFVQLARASQHVIDVGANTGMYSVLSALANTGVRVWAFEPNPTNHARLLKNVELNHLKNVEVMASAVGDSTQPITFTIPREARISYTSSALGEFSKSSHGGQWEWQEITVPQVTLSEHFSDRSTKIDLLKIDVEGYEVSVFEGGKTFFRHHSPVVLCEIFLTADKQAYFQEFLREFGYHAYLVLHDGLLRLGNQLSANHGNNFLFSRGKTRQVFTSYADMPDICRELLQKPAAATPAG